MVRMYRTMLVQERDGGLFLLQGTPRRWLADGEEIRLERVPTWYGPLSLACRSRLQAGRVEVKLELPDGARGVPVSLHLRLPEGASIERVEARPSTILATDGEWIRFEGRPGPLALRVDCRPVRAPVDH